MAVIAPPPPALRVPRLEGRRAVVADDDGVCRRLAADALAAAGAAVQEAPDGRDAVLAVTARRADVLVTDLDMPRLGGLAAVAILRWDFGLRDLPIIALSAGAPPASELLSCGVNAFLPKPVAADALVAAVAACLAGTAAAPVGGDEGGGDALLDDAGALARMGGRRDLLARMLAAFLADHDGAAGAVADDLDAGRAEAAHRRAHALAGTAASVGAMRLHRAARAVERCLREGAPVDPPRLAALRDVHAATLAAARAWLGHGR